MNVSMPLENQLLTTKFYVPIPSGPRISRPRLTGLLNESVRYPLTLVSAAAGFGKTTLLATWSQSLPPGNPWVAWVSLDEEDNEPRLFWAYVLTALNMQQPERFSSLLMQLQSLQSPPLNSLLAALINLLAEGTDHFVLILDDYQLITEQQVHTTLAYLIERLPPQLRIIVATRADPPLPLPLLRARQQALEVHTDQLRCTVEETRAFFQEVMGLQLPDDAIQQVRSRTEGWLVGLQLLGLSLPERTDPLALLQEISGDQRYILDYLTEEVLQRQPQQVQTFLLSTCILERLSASLCDAVMECSGSQQMLQQLERTNLFVVSLDSKREWYRYHALFAEALCYRLEQMQGDLVSALHHRASLWYAKHDRTTQAILHAFKAREWQWAADLIEQKRLQLDSYTWGASEHELVLLREWLAQLPLEVMGSRPRFCLTCVQLLWQVASPILLGTWLKAIEATLSTPPTIQRQENVSEPVLAPKAQQEQHKLLGEVLAARAFLQSIDDHGETVLPLCQQAFLLLSADNYYVRTLASWAQLYAHYCCTNDTEAAIQSGLQAVSLAQTSGHSGMAITAICLVARLMKDVGQLHEAEQLTCQATQLGRKPGGLLAPEAGYPSALQAEILREWNQLDEASARIEEAIQLSKQSKTTSSLAHVLLGHAVLLRISLSRGELEKARSALQEFERIASSINQPSSLHYRCFYTTVDQVRLWLASGERDRAIHWVEKLDLGEQLGTPFARERQEVARVYILLATAQPNLALQRLEPVLKRATTGQRWSHVIEVRLLQALAHQMLHEEPQALNALSEAVQLAEPEGYIRSFVDEGVAMEALLYRLRKRNRKQGPTPYLDTLLAAFQQESKAHGREEKRTRLHQLPEPLSARERQVLQLLDRGASNLEMAQELVISLETVKRHVNHIFSKLGVRNRVQAVQQARELGLLDKEG